MARIVIFEDCVLDVVERYRNLLDTEHQFKIFYELLSKIDLEYLTRAGFKSDSLENFDPLNPVKTWEPSALSFNADIYLIDGLRGTCFNIADSLGINKSFITSTDFYIKDKARREGYKVYAGLENALAQI